MSLPSYEAAERALAARLGERSLVHSRAVAGEAARIAEHCGVDREAARIAGLLHDWDRELSDAEVTAAAARRGSEALGETVEGMAPKLLHAWTGAAAIREAFPGIDDAVVHAVARHTVGDVDMMPLDKVVYVADMTEPGRGYPGVEELRAAVGEVDLDELFARAYTASVDHLVRKRKPIHPDTVRVWNAHVARKRS